MAALEATVSVSSLLSWIAHMPNRALFFSFHWVRDNSIPENGGKHAFIWLHLNYDSTFVEYFAIQIKHSYDPQMLNLKSQHECIILLSNYYYII